MGYDSNAEEQAVIQDVLNEGHVSMVDGLAISLVGKGDIPDTVILLFSSCCGTSAYAITPLEAKETIEGLQRCLIKMVEFGGHSVN